MSRAPPSAPAELDEPYDLPAGSVEAFGRDGFIRLKRVFGPAVLETFGREITRATIALSTESRALAERSTYGQAFLQVMNLWRRDAAARRFVFGKRLARLAAELLEVEGVRLYHDQSLYKEPGGGLTPAHADQGYWPLATDRSVTAWVPLQATPDELGPLGFYAGSHAYDQGRDLAISDESEREISARMQASGFPLVASGFELGEVSFHLGATFHRAGPNTSQAARSVMTVIYIDADMRLKAPDNPMQANDWAAWCPGAKVGELIDTPLNPVLFRG
jgi:ectoine hydroxylase-related dioxygenase (phytanoyl-CoA dioxygenase family)